MIIAIHGILASSGSASAPVNTIAPTITGTNAVTNMLTANNGTWTGSTPITYTYQWRRNGVNIPSATSITYTLVQADAGNNIDCVVTGTNIIGSSSANSNSVLCFDLDAYNFNTATAINNAQSIIINDLVLDLKSANLWTKYHALYPVIGGTATTHKFNLKNPLDTNTAFRLSFSGGWTHSSTGMLPNGVNTFANSFLVPSTNLSLNSTHLSYYATTGGIPASYGITMGSVVNIGDFAFTYIGTASDSYFYPLISSGTTGGTNLFYVPNRYNSLMIGNRNSSASQDGWSNNGKTSLPRASYALNSASLYIGARNYGGSTDNYGTNQCRFASIGQGLTDLECQVFYAIVEKYQVALSRSVNPTLSFYYNRSYSNELNAYLFSTQITNTSTQLAIGTMIDDLKSANLWTKMKAIYPMTTDKVLQVDMASQMKFNLIDPQDTNSAFRLAWAGGWAYSSNGATPNGTNAYANTFLSKTNLTELNTHISYYSRSNIVNLPAIEMGIFGSGSNTFNMLVSFSGVFYLDMYDFNTNRVSINNSDSRGFYLGSRISSTSLKAYKNGVQFSSTNTNTSTGWAALNGNMTIGNRNDLPAGNYTNKECAFSSIGDGLTDLEAQVFYAIVEKFQLALSRNTSPTQSFYYNGNYNNETNAYLFSTQITNTTIQGAVNTLVNQLKTFNIWTKMKALYPMVTDKVLQADIANQMKFNLANSQDSNSAFRLTWTGGWTYSSVGAIPNGINSYADTQLIPGSVLTTNSTHLSFYTPTDNPNYAFDLGVVNGFGAGNPTLGIVSRSSALGGAAIWVNSPDAGRLISGTANSVGFVVASRNGSTTVSGYKTGVLINSNTSTPSAVTSYQINISALNGTGTRSNFSNRVCSFASIGDGLSATEVANLYTAVQNFQITLGRSV